MNRRITAFFPFSNESTLYAGNGVSPEITGTFAGEGLTYGKYEASDGSCVVSLLPYTDSKNPTDQNCRSLSIDRDCINYITVNPGGMYNWAGVGPAPPSWPGYITSHSSGSASGANFAESPFPNYKATYFDKALIVTGTIYIYMLDATYDSILTSAQCSCYLKILNGAQADLISSLTTVKGNSIRISSADTWVRPWNSGTRHPLDNLFFWLDRSTSNALNAQLLACMAQYEPSPSLYMGPTPFTSSTRLPGKFRLPKTLIEDTSNFSFSTWVKYSYLVAGDSRLSDAMSVGTILHVENATSAIGSINEGNSITLSKQNLGLGVRLRLPISSGSDLVTDISTGWTSADETSASFKHVGITVSSSQAIVYIDGVSAEVILPPSGYTFRSFGVNRDILLGHDGSTIYTAASSAHVSAHAFLNGSLADTLFATGILTGSQMLDLYKMGSAGITFNDLNHPSLPQPTVQITSEASLLANTSITRDGHKKINLKNPSFIDKLSLQWGPLLESEVYKIKDFIDANGNRLAFWFTPPVGPRGKYRFDPASNISITTKKPNAHEIRATIIRVD